MSSKSPTRWVRADHLLALQEELIGLVQRANALLKNLERADCFQIESAPLFTGTAKQPEQPRQPEQHKPGAPDLLPKLTRPQIEEAAKYRRNVGHMPDWLPERITAQDHQAIIKRALETLPNARQLASSGATHMRQPDGTIVPLADMPPPAKPEEQKAKRTRESFRQANARLRKEYGGTVMDYTLKQIIGDQRNAVDLKKAYEGFLGTFFTVDDAGTAFAKAHKLTVDGPEQAARALLRAKHLIRHQDGTVSVWRAHKAPGEMAVPA